MLLVIGVQKFGDVGGFNVASVPIFCYAFSEISK